MAGNPARPASDELKRELLRELHGLISEARGRQAQFPLGQEPQLLLQRLQLGVLRRPDSDLTEAAFRNGFSGMQMADKRAWLADIRTGRFKLLVLTTQNPSSPKSLAP